MDSDAQLLGGKVEIKAKTKDYIETKEAAEANDAIVEIADHQPVDVDKPSTCGKMVRR